MDGLAKKCWGTTRCTKDGPAFAVHELELLAGGFCSIHYHRERANRFLVKEGLVRVVFCYGWKVEHVLIKKNESYEVPSLVVHQFQVLEAGSMTEVYWADRNGTVANDDIIRLTEGDLTDPEIIKSCRGFMYNSSLRSTDNLRDKPIWSIG